MKRQYCQCLLLQGTAEPPKHAGAITQEIPCKTAHTELLPVENWLRQPQRFRVTIDMIRPEKLDRSVSLDGLDYIDVPALARRDYQLHFYSFKECSILAKVSGLLIVCDGVWRHPSHVDNELLS